MGFGQGGLGGGGGCGVSGKNVVRVRSLGARDCMGCRLEKVGKRG